MKGLQGLIVAAMLGGLGLALNWLYLQNKTKGVESESLLGIRPDVTIPLGQDLRAEDFVEVRVPKNNSGNLREFVYLWSDKETVAGIRATRMYRGGDLVFRDDYRTPAQDLKWENKDDGLIWVEVDSRSFVPGLISPGDEVSFIVPSESDPGTGNATGGGNVGLIPLTPQSTELIGPFRVKSVGNRLGSVDVMQANRMATSQERQIGIVVRKEGNQLEALAMKLLDRMQRSNNRSISVYLHGRPTKSP